MGACSLGSSRSTQNPVLVVAVNDSAVFPNRTTEGLSLRYVQQGSFSFKRRRWRSPAVVIECRDHCSIPTFSAMAVQIADRLKSMRSPIAKDVLAVFDEWEDLFCRVSLMTSDEELGLWGELWLISRAKSVDAAVSGWIAHENSRVDFLAYGRGFEVKTSRSRLRHHISHAQSDSPLGSLPSYFVSIWCADVERGGQSLPELVERISVRCSDGSGFERKLLARGYSRRNAESYIVRHEVLECPGVFPSDAVPRIRSVDVGVLEIRYVASLDEARALAIGTIKEIALISMGIEWNDSFWRIRDGVSKRRSAR
jgi:hypothetical protein